MPAKKETTKSESHIGMSIHQCKECADDPDFCTDEMKSTCPFHRLKTEQMEKVIC